MRVSSSASRKAEGRKEGKLEVGGARGELHSSKAPPFLRNSVQLLSNWISLRTYQRFHENREGFCSSSQSTRTADLPTPKFHSAPNVNVHPNATHLVDLNTALIQPSSASLKTRFGQRPALLKVDWAIVGTVDATCSLLIFPPVDFKLKDSKYSNT